MEDEMKLCIPTDSDLGMDARVASHFGTAPFFTMVDLGTDEVRPIRNPSCGHHPGECHHVDILQAHHVQVLCCAGIGRHALEGVERAGIRVLAPTQSTVREIAEAIRRGEVEPMTIANVCSSHGDAEGGHHCRHRHRHQHQHRHGAAR
jgi:predicted Fe-Mo cluster-binding NifX family protein